jgi:hypothetical protein
VNDDFTHAMFLELMREPEVGMVRLRMQDCLRCKSDLPHWFICLSVQPRVWGYRCTICNPKEPELEAA